MFCDLSCRMQVASSAQYIIQQFRATTGCSKRERTAKSMYASGRVRMEMAQEHGVSSSGSASKGHHKGCFVVWQMVPDMWLVEFAVSGHQIAAGSDGKVAWRRTPWLGAHAARGGVRPLRRALQASGPDSISLKFLLFMIVQPFSSSASSSSWPPHACLLV